MKKLHLPYVNLPLEFTTLLKSSLNISTSPAPIFDVLKSNKALLAVLDNAFKEFDDGRGLEKVMLALSWLNFRERMASLYIYKRMHGNFPSKTNMELVEEIKEIESRFTDHSVNSYSRLFLLGFYLKLANINLAAKDADDIRLPPEVGSILKLSQGRSERIDWLILLVLHLLNAFGAKMLSNALASGKKFDDLYAMMPTDLRESMHENFLAYGASIKEADPFLYEKI